MRETFSVKQDFASGKCENAAQRGLAIIGNWLTQVIEKAGGAGGGRPSSLAGCQGMEQWNGYTLSLFSDLLSPQVIAIVRQAVLQKSELGQPQFHRFFLPSGNPRESSSLSFPTVLCKSPEYCWSTVGRQSPVWSVRCDLCRPGLGHQWMQAGSFSLVWSLVWMGEWSLPKGNVGAATSGWD